MEQPATKEPVSVKSSSRRGMAVSCGGPVRSSDVRAGAVSFPAEEEPQPVPPSKFTQRQMATLVVAFPNRRFGRRSDADREQTRGEGIRRPSVVALSASHFAFSLSFEGVEP